MAQFTLHWSNTALLTNTNAIGQRVSHRQRRLGGAFITTGYTPPNDMAKSVTSADTPILVDNVVYEFKVQTLCTVSGPIDNDNGLQEGINFVCLTPVLTHTDKTASITLDLTNLDITKARFTLRKASDNTIVIAPTIALRVADSIIFNVTGLAFATNYYWQVELYAIVNSVEVISSDLTYLGTVCSPYPFTTSGSPACASVETIVVHSIEI